MVSDSDCEERANVRRFSPIRVDDCSTNPHDVANKKLRAYLFITAKAPTVTTYQ